MISSVVIVVTSIVVPLALVLSLASGDRDLRRGIKQYSLKTPNIEQVLQIRGK